MGGWGLFNQNFGIDQILDSGKVLCYAAKWHGKKDVIFARHDESHFLPLIHALLDEADAVVTFNGRRHDLPLLNREFIKAGLTPPSPYAHIDLLETVKKQFKFPSNKLDWLLRELELGQKKEHEGFPLWIKVLKDDVTAWKIMKNYNIADTKLTEKLYNKLLPWIESHPNRSLHSTNGKHTCPNCGSHSLQSRGLYFSKTQTYRRFVCTDCGKWSRSRYTEVGKEERQFILTGAS